MAKRALPSLPDIKRLIGDNYDRFVGLISGGVTQDAAPDNIAAATGGAISVTNYLTTINTDAGGDNFTLADGTHEGQLKKILLLADGGGNAVVTPANLAGGTTLTFDNAGEWVLLRWNGSEWRMIDVNGVALA